MIIFKCRDFLEKMWILTESFEKERRDLKLQFYMKNTYDIYFTTVKFERQNSSHLFFFFNRDYFHGFRAKISEIRYPWLYSDLRWCSTKWQS